MGSFVMRGRQHLCLITAAERVLMLITLRFAEEIRPMEEVSVPSASQAKISAREVAMAEKLVEQMNTPWRPEKHHDSYREDLMERIQEKIHNKQTHVLTPKEKPSKESRQSAQVIDLMSVLKKSLESHGGERSGRRAGETGASRRAPKRAPARHRRRA